jgi:hypothetical protein
MKLKDCTHGKIVVTKDGIIGMIVGITNNCGSGDLNTRNEPDRAIPLVQWANGRTGGIHHGNIEPLK